MKFNERLKVIRREKNISQEKLAEIMNVSRQAVAKWESNSGYPDINNLITLSDFFKISLDQLIKSDTKDCSVKLESRTTFKEEIFLKFLVDAKQKTYAGNGKKEEIPSRPNSQDLKYSEGDYLYIDTFLGSENFSGQEAVWFKNDPIWSLNYYGRVIDEPFSGAFLKEVLSLVSIDNPFRAPLSYHNGAYSYHARIIGDINCFDGCEEIFYESNKVYECFFHGGIVK